MGLLPSRMNVVFYYLVLLHLGDMGNIKVQGKTDSKAAQGFGGPKGLPMHLYGLGSLHFFIKYDINPQNLVVFPPNYHP